ncbi:MAG: PQQ-binding-like beta-propeller repeat protein [Myxococcales bacterium]|nr:PQQ-binding-like beta-propeller repeat protein [Myxococcales bacterium]
MTPKIQCAYCNAPLAADLGVVICTYCHKPNNPSGLPGKTAIRQIARDVVYEDSNNDGIPDVLDGHLVTPHQPAWTPGKPYRPYAAYHVVFLVLGVVIACGLAAFSFYGAKRQQADALTRTAVTSVSRGDSKPSYGADPKIIQVHQGSVYFATNSHIVRAARSSLRLEWAQPFAESDHYPAGLVVTGDRVIVMLSDVIMFYDKASGAVVKRYEGAVTNNEADLDEHCVAGGLIAFGRPYGANRWLQFDTRTGAKVDGAAACRPRDLSDTYCPEGQACKRTSFKRSDMKCNLTIKAGTLNVLGCQMLDGTLRGAVVAISEKNVPVWQTPSDGKAGDAEFMAVVGERVVVVRDKTVTSYETATGAIAWSVAIDGSSRRAFAVDFTCFYAVTASHIAAFSLKTGKQTALF